MARRHAEKARGRTVSAPTSTPRARSKPASGSERGLKDRLAAIERERDSLRSELDRLQARVRALEKTQSHVRDRIAWAVEALQSIVEKRD